MSYIKSIVIQSLQTNREVSLEVSLPSVPDTGHLSSLSLNSIESIITDLNWIILQPTGVITWGVDHFMVDSDHEGCLCRNFEGEEIADIPTNIMRDLMNEIKSFKQYYQNSVNLGSVVTQAFNSIKSNPNQYKRWADSSLYYIININGIDVCLTLESADFNLSSGQYINQLDLN